MRTLRCLQLLLTSLPRRARAAGLLLRLPASQPEQATARSAVADHVWEARRPHAEVGLDHFLEGDISMLYKKGDREDPRNYRLITLLNSDYKACSHGCSPKE